MPTIPADIRISVKRKDKATRKIELVGIPFSQKFWIRIDGKKSQKTEAVSLTEVTHKLRQWLCQGVKK